MGIKKGVKTSGPEVEVIIESCDSLNSYVEREYQNIAGVLYFRRKLFDALRFPESFLKVEVPSE